MANAFSPQTFKDIIAGRGGLATTEKFEVIFSDLPTGLDNSVNRDLQFLCENVALPTKSLSAGEKSIYGVTYQMPYKVAYQELSMTFMLTEDMAQKKFFDEWQNKIIDPNTGNLNYYNTYVCKMLIRKHKRRSTGFGGRDSSPYEITIEGAWPSIVAEVQLSHGGGNEVARLPVTIQYKRWISGNVTGNVGQTPMHQLDPMFDSTSPG